MAKKTEVRSPEQIVSDFLAIYGCLPLTVRTGRQLIVSILETKTNQAVDQAQDGFATGLCGLLPISYTNQLAEPWTRSNRPDSAEDFLFTLGKVLPERIHNAILFGDIRTFNDLNRECPKFFLNFAK